MLRYGAARGSRLLVRQRACRTLSSSAAASAVVPTPKGVVDTTTNDENNKLPTKLIDFQVASKIEGEESHIVTVELRPGEMLRAESGAMVYMTEGVVMETQLNGASSAFNRFLTGQNLFLTDFTYHGDSKGTVCLGTDFPSKILRFTLEDHPDRTLICQKGAFLASNPQVDLQVEFTKTLTAGFFGGQGFALQKLTGQGDVLVKGGGTVVKKELGPGEVLRVTSGSLVAFESTIQYDVQMLPGIKNVMFGGEGLFVTTLTGPGNIWLQGMPPDRMIAEIARRVPSGGIGMGIPIGMGGGGGGGGGAEGAAGTDEAAAAAAGTEGATGGGEEAVAATDAAMEADRNATVATSGMSTSSSDVDADSPTALFGDAAPDKPESASTTTDDASSFATESTQPTYTDDDFSTSMQQDEQSFDDSSTTASDDFSSGGDESLKDGELFDDTTSSGDATSPADGDGEGGGLLQTLWDFFTSDD